MFDLLRTGMQCGTLITLAFVILLSMPQSRLRQIVMPVLGWMFAAFCAVYALSPFDLVPETLLGPFGLVDDLGAMIAAIAAVRASRKAAAEPVPATAE